MSPLAVISPGWRREHGPSCYTCIAYRQCVARDFQPLLHKHAPQSQLGFDTVDLHYLRESRAAEVAGDAARARTAQRTRALELDVIARSNLTLVVSGAERDRKSAV